MGMEKRAYILIVFCSTRINRTMGPDTSKWRVATDLVPYEVLSKREYKES